MSLLSKIFDFIKSLATRPGLHTFLKKYQQAAIETLEELAQVHGTSNLNSWWDEAFNKFKALATADGKNISDNWVAIALNLGYEVIKAKAEAPVTPSLPPPPAVAPAE